MFTLSAVALVAAASCSSNPEATIETSRPAIVDDTTASLENASTTALADAGATTAEASPETTTAVTTSTPPATAAPSTSPPSTTPPSATPAPTPPPSTTPQGSGALTPAFVAFNVSTVSECPAPDASVPLGPREVVVSWEVIGTESVYVAIDNVDGPFATDLPPAGSITLPHNCPDGNTYFVVAENPEGRTIEQATR